MLNNNIVSSEDLVNIFTIRALTLNNDLEMVTFENYKEAILLAKNCDEQRAQQKEEQNKKPSSNFNPPENNEENQQYQGELFGIPISIKDAFLQKGFASTIGCTLKINEIQQSDGLILTILKKSGAIPFIRSNMPQCGMTNESVNHLFGRVKNPWDLRRSAGGSSGGEGALIASRSSPLGIGSDVAGSIRMPAAFCGICGFKPTAQRVTMKGHSSLDPTFAGFQAFKCSIGPMGKYVDDLAIQMKVLCNKKYYSNLPLNQIDPYHQVISFNQQEYEKFSANNNDRKNNLVIGYFSDLEIFPLGSAAKRALKEAKSYLQNQGHTLVEMRNINTIATDLVLLFFQLFGSDGGAIFDNMLQGEKMIEEYGMLKTVVRLPKLMRRFLSWFLESRFKQRRAAQVLRNFKACSSCDYRVAIAELNKLQERFYEEWSNLHLDAVLSPGFPIPALQHGMTKELGLAASYMLIWNLLNAPTGCLPVTVVGEDEENYIQQINWEQFQGIKDNITLLTDQVEKSSRGMPVGVQISTLPYQEEKCLGIMKQLEGLIQFYNKHPLPV